MGHDAYDDAVANRGARRAQSDPIAYDHAMEDRHNREKQAAFAAHNFQRRSQYSEEVTLPGDVARLICEHIDSLEHEVHRLRNGIGRYGA